MRNLKDTLYTALTGLLMALADSVPGVSGGTIAYVLGKYDDFIGSIAELGSLKNKNEKKKAIIFLIKLLSGWIIGMLISMLVIANLFRTRTYELVSLFLGFVIISIPFIIKEERIIKDIKLSSIISLLIGFILVISITLFSNNLVDLNTSNKLLLYLYVFIVGAIAICAMVLPGISGSTFLLIFGLYVIIVTAVKNTLKFNFSQIDIVLVFGIGVIIGLLLFTKLVRYLLNNYRNLIVNFIIGLMFGSIYAIIMGPTSLTDEITKQNLNLDSLNFNNFSILWFIVGMLVIVILEKLKNIVKK